MPRLLKSKRNRSRLAGTAALLLLTVLPGFAATQAEHPPLQRGVHVELAGTHHARPAPAADRPGAVIVAVTQRGTVLLGAVPAAPNALARQIRQKSPTTVYLKLDARAPYSAVATVLGQLRQAGVSAAVLLTEQRDPSDSMPVPPKGLDVRVSAPAAAAHPVTLTIPAKNRNIVKFNGANVPLSALPARLHALPQNPVATVIVKADGQVPFGRVVQVIDACRGASVAVALVP